MSFFKEFKEFINQGDVMDMAVGIIIGGALTAIVTALTSDIIQPLINFITAGTPRSGDWSFRERESTSGRSSAPHQLPHHRVHRVLPRQGRQQDEKRWQEEGRGGTCRTVLPVLPRGGQGGRDAMPALRRGVDAPATAE